MSDPRDTAEGRHYRALTHSYVKWLGLEPFLHYTGTCTATWTAADGTSIERTLHGYDYAVVYNHTLYVRSPCGRSWDWSGG